MKEHPGIKMPLDSLGHLCERLPAGVRDPHAHNASLSTVGDHALEGALRIFEKHRGLILDELERQPSE